MSDIQILDAAVAVIDDDPYIRDLLRSWLELEGFSVHVAADGGEGVALIQAMQPRCVVLDLMMPVHDGHDVLRAIRARHGFGVPVIMLTAAADDAQEWRAWSGGVDCFLPKPIDADELLQRVQQLASEASPRSVPAVRGAP